MTPALVFSLCAIGSFGLALVFWLEERRTKRAVPRMLLTTGVVRELETVLVNRASGSVRSTTLVQVDFVVDGKTYTCRSLRLFEGNRHLGDAGKKFDFPPGHEVGVFYDPIDPRRSALILDESRQGSTVWAVVMGIIFVIIALVKSG